MNGSPEGGVSFMDAVDSMIQMTGFDDLHSVHVNMLADDEFFIQVMKLCHLTPCNRMGSRRLHSTDLMRAPLNPSCSQ